MGSIWADEDTPQEASRVFFPDGNEKSMLVQVIDVGGRRGAAGGSQLCAIFVTSVSNTSLNADLPPTRS
jgi:hypothetical protein